MNHTMIENVAASIRDMLGGENNVMVVKSVDTGETSIVFNDHDGNSYVVCVEKFAGVVQ